MGNKKINNSKHSCNCKTINGNHSHNHNHNHSEHCCGSHSHAETQGFVSVSQDTNESTCSCHSEDVSEDSEHSSCDEEKSLESEHNHTHESGGCGCGCETTSSMKDFLVSKPKKALESEHNHTHESGGCGCGCETTSSMKDFLVSKPKKALESEHNHTHESGGCSCGCETTSSMKSFLVSESIHNEHNHKHDESCDCKCNYCESMRAFLIDKKAHSESHNHHDHDHDHSIGNLPIIVLAIVLFLGAFVLERVPIFTNQSLQRIIMAILALISYIIMGYKTIIGAFNNIKRGDWFGESFLMTIATFGAIAIGEYPEAAAVMLLFNIGEYFQARAVDRSRHSISELMDIRPDFANLVVGEKTKVVAPEELKVGDIIVIKAGEKVPVDSTVIEGFTTIDNKALTGESIPVEVIADDRLLSGSINISGLIKARVDREYGASTVSKILELVQNASEKKSTQERFITRFSKVYTPIVVVLAIVIAFVVPFVTGGEFVQWFKRSLIFLVISCPCALVISVPLSFFAGIGGASKRGILFKGSSYIEQLAKVKAIMFDKTGTLTKGQFEVANIFVEKGFTEEEVLEKASIAEFNSNHPIAKSIVREYRRRMGKDISIDKVSLEELSGFGVRALVDGDVILAGNAKLMKNNNIEVDVSKFDTTVVYVAKNNTLIGVISIEDKAKDDAKPAITKLNDFGIETVMLTGDNTQIANKVANNLGIKKVYAELLPQHKVEKVEEELAKSGSDSKIAFVGDGINDAPVLARADIGIAMGGVGSDAAIEAADIVLMTDEPSKIAEAIKIAKKTISVASQNIVFALGIKIVVMVLGVLGIANMWLAVFADVGVSIIAVLNAMRAYKTQN